MLFFKNKNCRNIFNFFMASCVTLTLVMFCAFVLSRKDSRFKSKPFFTEKQDIDVFFLGTSHGVNAFFPMELWEDFGIVSYNLSYHNALLPMQYWVLKNALNYKKPKLVVIDLFWLSSSYKSDPSLFGTVHTVFDEFPLIWDKVLMANDILDDDIPAARNPKAKFGLLFPFSVYHTRWTEFYTDNFNIGVEKGAESRIAVNTIAVSFEPIERDNKISEDSIGIIYLKKIIELCKDKEIDILPVYLPFAAWASCQREANAGYSIAKNYKINYLNFLEHIDILDFDTDLYDSVGHLNPSGARKVNDYLGKYILENYNIQNKKENPLYKKWHDDYNEYREFKISNLKAQTSLETYLMLLSDKHFTSKIEIYKPEVLQNKIHLSLIKNSGGDIIDSSIKTAYEKNVDVMITVFDCDTIIDRAVFIKDETGNVVKTQY